MLDLRDVTFTIPVRYDTDDRIRNFRATLSYMAHNLATNIIIYEEGPVAKFQDLAVQLPNCRYNFDQTNSDVFHRTRILNQMAMWATTPYIVNYDVDCIVHLPVYQDAVTKLRNGEFDIMTGFDSFTWNVPKMFHDRIAARGNIDWLTIDHCLCANTADKAMGGIVWWNKAKFIEAGMENQNFISWGPEDQERVYRAQKLGYKYTKISGTLFHLDHTRLANSWMNHRLFQHNEEEFERVKKMTEEELRAYVNTWSWVPK